MKTGVIYTETMVHAAPEQFVADAPYQLVIVSLDGGGRLTARISPREPGARVAIGDAVELDQEVTDARGGIPFFRKR